MHRLLSDPSSLLQLLQHCHAFILLQLLQRCLVTAPAILSGLFQCFFNTSSLCNINWLTQRSVRFATTFTARFATVYSATCIWQRGCNSLNMHELTGENGSVKCPIELSSGSTCKNKVSCELFSNSFRSAYMAINWSGRLMEVFIWVGGWLGSS